MKKKKPVPRKDDVWTFEHSEFMEDAVNSAREDLLLTHDIENYNNEKEFIERLETLHTIFNVKLSDVIVQGIRAKNAPAKGGRAAKKEPSFALLVQYAWEKSKRKTCLSMWKFLMKELELSGGDTIIKGCDFEANPQTNRITLFYKNGGSRDIGFRTFQRYVKDFRKELKK